MSKKVPHHTSAEETGPAEYGDQPPRGSCLNVSVIRVRHELLPAASLRRPALIALSCASAAAESGGSRPALVGSRRASRRSGVARVFFLFAWRTPASEGPPSRPLSTKTRSVEGMIEMGGDEDDRPSAEIGNSALHAPKKYEKVIRAPAY